MIGRMPLAMWTSSAFYLFVVIWLRASCRVAWICIQASGHTAHQSHPSDQVTEAPKWLQEDGVLRWSRSLGLLFRQSYVYFVSSNRFIGRFIFEFEIILCKWIIRCAFRLSVLPFKFSIWSHNLDPQRFNWVSQSSCLYDHSAGSITEIQWLNSNWLQRTSNDWRCCCLDCVSLVWLTMLFERRLRAFLSGCNSVYFERQIMRAIPTSNRSCSKVSKPWNRSRS